MIKIETKTIIKIALAILAVYIVIHFLPAIAEFSESILGAALPLIIGCVIAYPVNILMSFYERHWFPAAKAKFITGSRRGICLLLAIISLVAITALVIALIVPQLVSCVKLIIDLVPDFIADIIAFIDKYDLMSDANLAKIRAIDWESKLGQIFNTVTAGVTGIVNIVISTLSSIFSIITTALFSIIFAIYLLLGKDKLGSQCNRMITAVFNEKTTKRIDYVVGILDDCFHKFIVGQCTEAVILGALVTVGMWILKLPYAAMIGATMAFTALIPIVGAFIGAGVGVFLIIMQSPVKALVFLVFILILQQLENNLVYPRVVGTSIGLPGMWVLASVTIGGGVLGVAGMMLGVPLAAAAYRMTREYIAVRQMQKNAAVCSATAENAPCAEAENSSEGGSDAETETEAEENE